MLYGYVVRLQFIGHQELYGEIFKLRKEDYETSTGITILERRLLLRLL